MYIKQGTCHAEKSPTLLSFESFQNKEVLPPLYPLPCLLWFYAGLCLIHSFVLFFLLASSFYSCMLLLVTEVLVVFSSLMVAAAPLLSLSCWSGSHIWAWPSGAEEKRGGSYPKHVHEQWMTAVRTVHQTPPWLWMVLVDQSRWILAICSRSSRPDLMSLFFFYFYLFIFFYRLLVSCNAAFTLTVLANMTKRHFYKSYQLHF